MIFQHDCVSPHISKTVQETLKFFNWENLLQPPYSTDIAQSDCHLSISNQSAFSEERSSPSEKVIKLVHQWIPSKEPDFFYRGIHLLSEKLEIVVLCNGNYFE